MALQALADYSMMAYSGGNLDISLGIKFSCDDDIRKLHVTEENSLLLQIEQIPEVPVEIKMTATGSGCALTQVTTYPISCCTGFRSSLCRVENICLQLNIMS